MIMFHVTVFTSICIAFLILLFILIHLQLGHILLEIHGKWNPGTIISWSVTSLFLGSWAFWPFVIFYMSCSFTSFVCLLTVVQLFDYCVFVIFWFLELKVWCLAVSVLNLWSGYTQLARKCFVLKWSSAGQYFNHPVSENKKVRKKWL